MAMPKVSPADTASLFIGSGALDYCPWYVEVKMSGVDFAGRSADDWSVVFTHYDPDAEERVASCSLDHASLMRAIRRIADGKESGVDPHSAVGRMCRALIFKGPDADEVDFDAPLADAVMQVAALGTAIYA